MIGDRYIISPLMTYVRCRGESRYSLDRARVRLVFSGFAFVLLLVGILARLVDMTLFQGDEKYSIDTDKTSGLPTARANIVDRHGEILATTLVTGSLYANATLIHKPQEVAKKLAPLLEGSVAELTKKLSSGRRFVWLERHLTPKQQVQIIKLGIPGLDIIRDKRRVYPHGPMTAHLVGMTDVDNQGISGIEFSLDSLIRTSKKDVRLSLDSKVQNALYDELEKGKEEFRARSVNGIVMHIETGEILAMASLPSYNPNVPKQVDYTNLFDRNVTGEFELGSIMKLVNTALALEESKASIHKTYNATAPLKVGRFRIKDEHAQNRYLTIAEIFQHSSNIGSGLMALEAGIDNQKAFFKRLGLLSPVSIELPGAPKPLYPRHWSEASAITLSYGYGISLSPLLFATTAASLLTGYAVKPTLLYRGSQESREERQPLISQKTVGNLRALMRLTVTQGTARKAHTPGYAILGKTGSAMQLVNGRYRDGVLTTSFVGALGPSLNKPEYLVFVTYDRPQETKKTYGFRLAGWNACATGGKVIQRMIAILGIQPSFPEEVDPDHDVNSLVKLASFEEK